MNSKLKKRNNSKVSIVMPCYNKEKHIGAMLESIISQDWDNIEVILVNDGSNDASREIIGRYESKLTDCGYDVIIIDQDNAGCCSAVYSGLKCITGDYLCVIDADDELDIQYVSTMASWLDKNPEYDYASCDYLRFHYDKAGKKIVEKFTPRIWPEDVYTPDFFLCNDASKAVWAFMTRTAYIEKCRLIDTFYTQTRGSYEPSFLIPFTICGGRMKHFSLPLYHYNSDADGLSQRKTFSELNAYWKEYHRVACHMLNQIPEDILDNYKKKHCMALSSFYVLKRMLLYSLRVRDGITETDTLRRNFLTYVNHWLPIEPQITYRDICLYPGEVCKAIELALSGIWGVVPKPSGRIIGYGALGRAAQRRLPGFEESSLKPTELWDIAGNGIDVKKPDFASLNENDIVLVFPTTPEIIDQVDAQMKKCRAAAFYSREFNDLLARIRFPQLGNI